MAYRKEAHRRGTRHQLWNKELFVEEVRAGTDSLRGICRKWSTDPDNYQGLINDTIVWRKEDPALDEECRVRFGEAPAPGRKSKEGENPDWRRLYCEEYIRTKSRVQAAVVTPYEWESIKCKLDADKSEYDPVFAGMVLEAESRLLDRAEQIMHEALEQESSWRNKAWIANLMLRARDRHRWSEKVDININANVRHSLDRGKVLAQLADTQQEFLERQRESLALPSGDYVEAEVVESDD